MASDDDALYGAISRIAEVLLPPGEGEQQPEPAALQALSDALRARPGTPEHVRATAEALRAALHRTESPARRRELTLFLDAVMSEVFKRTGGVEDLTAALEMCTAAFPPERLSGGRDGREPVGVVPVVVAWTRHSKRLLDESAVGRRELGRLVPLLVEAVRWCEREGEDRSRLRLLAETAKVLFGWNHIPGEVTVPELDAVIEPLSGLPLPPDEDFLGQALLSSLGTLRMKRFHRSGSRTHADQMVETYARLVAACEPEHRPYAVLGDALYSRYDRFGDRADLERGVAVLREGLDTRRSTAGSMRLALSRALFLRSAVTLSEDDWRAAVSDLDAAGSPERSAMTAGARARAEEAFAASVDLSAPDAQSRLRHVYELVTGGAAVTSAAADPDPDDPGRRAAFLWLARRLVDRFQRTHAAADYAPALAAARTAEGRVPAPEARRWRVTRADLLLAGYQATGSPADLDECAALLREHLASATDPGDRARALSQLSGALIHRYERTGAHTDLDGSIVAMRESVALTPAGETSRRGERLSNLTGKLMARAQLLGAGADLDEAIATGTEAVALSGNFAGEDSALGNLAGAYRERFLNQGRESDLDAALDALRKDLELSPESGPERLRAMSNLGSCLTIAAGSGRDTLDEGITLVRAALAETPREHPQRYARTVNLANVLLIRWLSTHQDADMDELLSVLRAVYEDRATPEPQRETCGYLLAIALENLHGRDPDAETARETRRLFSASAHAPFVAAQRRLIAARGWARTSEALRDTEGEEGALAAWSFCVDLLSSVSWRGLDRSDQESGLSAWTGTPSRAAACALDAGQPRLAVELLERGRSVLWTQLLHSRAESGALDRLAPGLAAELREVGAALEAGGASEATPSDRLVALGRRWDTLVERVDAELGEDSPFARPSYATLARAAEHGPVVLINTTDRRSDAVVVRPEPEGPLVVPLTGLGLDDTTERANTFLSAVARYEQGHTGPREHVALQMTMASTLEWLWDAVARPVLDALGLGEADAADETHGTGGTHGTGEPTGRIWWCPTGPLTLLPLHAAGVVGTGRGVWRRAVSSYTPTLQALLRARGPGTGGGAGAEPGAADGRLLTVGVAEAPGQQPLRYVVSEAEAVARKFPERPHTALVGERATRDRVRRELATCSWVHFACHGSQDPQEASNSAVVLHDGGLSVLDIARTRPTGAQLAYLSACRTAAGSALLLDEALHLTAGLQLAGFRHVVGTLWAIGDRSAALAADRFYDTLRASGSPAAATAAAAARLREDHPLEPSVWAAFVHFGP